MSKFKEGDIAYSASFKIVKNELLKIYPSTTEAQYSTARINADSYETYELLKDKNDVIDLMIKKLEEMKNDTR
jgi:hypothetical protein